MTVQQKNIPALRFPEFSEKWSKCTIGEITKKAGKKNKDRVSYPIYSINNINGFNPQSEQFDGVDSNVRGFDISLYKIVSNKTFAYNPARINVGSIGYNYDLGKVIVSSLYVCFQAVENIDDFFLYQYFKSFKFNKEVEKHGEGGVRIYLFFESLSKIKFAYPIKAEQQKIADFLSAVDERIQQLTRKKELLEQYKKGVMQQLFSRIIRFKTDEGNDYPDWEEKRLGEVAKYRRGSFPQPYGLKKWYNDENGYPFVQVFDVDDNMLLKENTKRRISDEAAELSVFAKKGTIVLTIQGSIGRIAITQYDAYVDRTLLIFRSFNIPMDKVFFAYIIYLLFEIEKQKAPGGTIKTITKEALSDFIIFIPVLDEQNKIADFLSGIDDKISGVQTEIEQTQQFKKGLLQQMFC